jgi:hypothetical protein
MEHATFKGIYVALFAVSTVAAHNLLTGGAINQREAAVIGNIRLTQSVLADGKLLPPGTYEVRLTGDQPMVAVGQARGSERWIEFVRNGTVAGREVATVIPANEIDSVAKGPRPNVNASRVDLLKGGEYVRVWLNRDGTNYIINMPPAR